MMAEVYAGSVVLITSGTLEEILETAKRFDAAEARYGGVRKIVILERERAAMGKSS